ncbi:DUF4190 domain-containing protein [Microbacterium sp. C7(2022)]|uniref:DUF4190 domain-containing protein n=1 Tax=Microbacterium sp. C7(2022) TaxID=2992759 RepID=UPI00237C0359|nr:DUF4190 domain-containing protein [Microbacterium sp. C7(2022)]MDE0547169.1 DUF4190 domain-containing protein [Microbacterium sp. C7(2022)]
MTDPQNPNQTPPNSGGAPQPPAEPASTTPPPAGATPPPAYSQAPSPPAYSQAPSAPPYGAAPGQQPYASAPPAAYGAPVSASVPGRTLGIVAFILSFFMQLIALILGIVALVQSKKAGAKNGFALAAIIISSVLLVLGIIFLIIFFAVLFPLIAEGTQQVYEFCVTNGPGVFEVEGVPIDCTEVLDM